MTQEILKSPDPMTIPIDEFERTLNNLTPSKVEIDLARPNPELTPYVTELTLASHGHGLEALVGGSRTVGILQTLGENGSKHFRLGGQQELNTLGIPIQGQTTSVEAYGGGEEGVSFEVQNLTGYGEVFWVMPASVTLQGGGVISIFDEPKFPNQEDHIGGLHQFSGELDVYSPFATILARLGFFNDFVDNLPIKIERYNKGDVRTREEFMKFGIITEHSDQLDEASEHEIEQKVVEQFEILRQAMIDTEKFWGVNLDNPLVLLMIPEKWEKQIRESVDDSDLDDELKEFINNQIIVYKNDLEEDESIEELHKFYSSLKDPEVYAERVLPNLRTRMRNQNLSVEDAVEILKIQETLLRFDRFYRDRYIGRFIAPSGD